MGWNGLSTRDLSDYQTLKTNLRHFITILTLKTLGIMGCDHVHFCERESRANSDFAFNSINLETSKWVNF